MRELRLQAIIMTVAASVFAATGLMYTTTASAEPSYPRLPGYTTACIDHDDTVTLAVGAAVAGDKGLTDCKVTITPMIPDSAGDYVVLTAPSGHREYFKLGPRTKP
jgi:hypothetical protein